MSRYLLNNDFDVEYPEGKKFAIVLTHDVDDVYVKLQHVFSSPLNCIRYGNYRGIIPILKGKINKKKSPYINFQNIINLEEKYNAKSTFYFLVNPQDTLGYKYYTFDLKNEIIKILDRGCEIGYHTGYEVYNNIKGIIKEKKILEELTGNAIIGARNHFLRFKTPDSWNVLAKAGFQYDSSFHYNDMVGFRNGMCHPFYPFDLNKNSIIKILEIPIVVSDIAFRSFMKINAVESWKYIKQLIDVTEKNKGVLTVLWHTWTFSYPVSIAGWFGKEWTCLYEKILKYAIEKNAWLTNCKELWSYTTKEGLFRK